MYVIYCGSYIVNIQWIIKLSLRLKCCTKIRHLLFFIVQYCHMTRFAAKVANARQGKPRWWSPQSTWTVCAGTPRLCWPGQAFLPLKKTPKTQTWVTLMKLGIILGLNWIQSMKSQLVCNGAIQMDLIIHHRDAPSILFLEENRHQSNSRRFGSVSVSTTWKGMKSAMLASLRTVGWWEDPCDPTFALAVERI